MVTTGRKGGLETVTPARCVGGRGIDLTFKSPTNEALPASTVHIRLTQSADGSDARLRLALDVTTDQFKTARGDNRFFKWIRFLQLLQPAVISRGCTVRLHRCELVVPIAVKRLWVTQHP